MNENRGVGKKAWLGLREFTQNTYPKLWKPLEHYFPDGLVNSDGEKVTTSSRSAPRATSTASRATRRGSRSRERALRRT